MAKSKQHITLQVQCDACNKSVTAYPLVNRSDLVAALRSGLDVRVMHVAADKDHIWSLSFVDKQALSKTIYQRFGLNFVLEGKALLGCRPQARLKPHRLERYLASDDADFEIQHSFRQEALPNIFSEIHFS